MEATNLPYSSAGIKAFYRQFINGRPHARAAVGLRPPPSAHDCVRRLGVRVSQYVQGRILIRNLG